MLSGEARQFCLDPIRPQKLLLDEMIKKTKERLNTAKRTRVLLWELEQLSFSIVKSKNLTCSQSEFLEKIVSELTNIQSSLPSEYRNDTTLQNKLLNAVRDISECCLVYHKPADTVQGVISDFHMSLATSKSFAGSSSVQQPIPARLVDRRYYHIKNSRQKSQTFQEKKFYLCGQPGCWFTNNNTKSRLQAMKKNKMLQKFIAELTNPTI